MKKTYQFGPEAARKGTLMLLSYFLFAACMQHDESLAPRNPQNDLLSKIESNDAGSVGAMSKRTFTAHLNSSNEVSGTGVDSKGTGQAIFRLNEDGTELYYKLIVANIDSVTQAHIHCGEAGVNGAVVVFLYGFNADGITMNGTLAEGIITPESIIPRADAPNCSGGLQTWDDLIERLQTGRSYVNVHTFAYPGGEIRGQIL